MVGVLGLITVKKIKQKTMTPEKKAAAYNDFFAFYVGRPISYFFSIPFIYCKVPPKVISIISILPLFISIYTFYVSKTILGGIIAWMLLFLWNILDGVDGNVARYNEQTSKIGSVYDAMSGYFAMFITFFDMGIFATMNSQNTFLKLDSPIYIVLGALTGMFVILPRLVMHKTISTFMDLGKVSGVKDKTNFNLVKVIALNISSISGGAQFLMLIAILFHMTDIYVCCYFAFNFLVMIVSLKDVLTE